MADKTADDTINSSSLSILSIPVRKFFELAFVIRLKSFKKVLNTNIIN